MTEQQTDALAANRRAQQAILTAIAACEDLGDMLDDLEDVETGSGWLSGYVTGHLEGALDTLEDVHGEIATA